MFAAVTRTSRRALPRGEHARTIISSRAATKPDEGAGDDTHNDFKPQVTFLEQLRSTVWDPHKTHAGPTASAVDVIQEDLRSNDVFVYMKGEPEAPMCGFSNIACRVLDAYRVPYGSRDVLSDPEVREAIKKHSQWPTIPQIYVKGDFVGGSDLLMEMHQKGELEALLKKSSTS